MEHVHDEIILLLARAPDNKVHGRTRLMKLLAAVLKMRKKGHLVEQGRFGEFVPQAYDDLAFLDNMGLIKEAEVVSADQGQRNMMIYKLTEKGQVFYEAKVKPSLETTLGRKVQALHQKGFQR